MMTRMTWLAPLAATALALAGCDDGEGGSADMALDSTANETLTASLNEAEDLTTVAELISDANLAAVFDGASAYTVLAPTDAAFAELGEGIGQLSPDGDTAPLVALLRSHIVTGHLRPGDLRAALKGASDGEVEMASVGSDPVTFTLDGDAIVARGPDGAQARLLVDQAVEANNGVLIPIDGLLRRLPAATTARR